MSTWVAWATLVTMPTKVQEGEVVVTLAMPEELRHKLKMIALENRSTLAATVVEALEQYVAKAKRKRR